MSVLSKPGFLKWLVIILLLVNAATLAYLFIGNNNKKPSGPRRGGKDFFMKELKFSEAQKVQGDSLHKIFSSQQQAIFGKIKLMKDSLYLYSNAKNDSALVNVYAEKISNQLKEMEKVTFYHFQRLRSICTPEQQIKLDTIINRMNNMQRGSRK